MILKMQKERKKLVYNFILFFILFSIAFFCSFFIREDKIDLLLNGLPNISGILLAGVLASLAILYGLLSDADLLRIRKRNLKRIEEQKCNDLFLVFLNSVKDDTIIIFVSFFISYVLILLINMDFTNFPKIFEIIPDYLSEHFKFFLLVIGLSVFFLSISCVYDIIDSVFILNKERYESSYDDEDKYKK